MVNKKLFVVLGLLYALLLPINASAAQIDSNNLELSGLKKETSQMQSYVLEGKVYKDSNYNGVIDSSDPLFIDNKLGAIMKVSSSGSHREFTLNDEGSFRVELPPGEYNEIAFSDKIQLIKPNISWNVVFPKSLHITSSDLYQDFLVQEVIDGSNLEGRTFNVFGMGKDTLAIYPMKGYIVDEPEDAHSDYIANNFKILEGLRNTPKSSESYEFVVLNKDNIDGRDEISYVYTAPENWPHSIEEDNYKDSFTYSYETAKGKATKATVNLNVYQSARAVEDVSYIKYKTNTKKDQKFTFNIEDFLKNDFGYNKKIKSFEVISNSSDEISIVKNYSNSILEESENIVTSNNGDHKVDIKIPADYNNNNDIVIKVKYSVFVEDIGFDGEANIPLESETISEIIIKNDSAFSNPKITDGSVVIPSTLESKPFKANVIDISGDISKARLELVQDSLPSKGVVKFNGLNIVYYPNQDVSGFDSFSYIVIDEFGNKSNVASYSIVLKEPPKMKSVDGEVILITEENANAGFSLFSGIIGAEKSEYRNTLKYLKDAKQGFVSPKNGNLLFPKRKENDFSLFGYIEYVPEPGYIGFDYFTVPIVDEFGQALRVRYKVHIYSDVLNNNSGLENNKSLFSSEFW